MHLRDRVLRLGMLVMLATIILGATAATALAVPANTLSVDQLQAKIDAAGGSLDGYLKTVVKGSTVVTIPVNVLAVTTGYGSGPVDMSSLILFEATGPVIDKIGGIAAGMSGSPIYVYDGAEPDKLIGALSYGDIFTKGGTGLATPIDAMTKLQTEYNVTGLFRTLSTPVVVDGQVKDRIMVTSDPESVKSEPANTVVAQPMSAVFIGGLNPNSRMYKAYAKVLESKGVHVVPLAGGLSSKVASVDAPLDAGSAVAILAARGDLWAGGVGTVTYRDDDDVVAFGHPAFYEGDTSLYMCKAWVDGIWPSTIEPYKMARPAQVSGTMTQDRLAGILGVDGQMPEETRITARATLGARVATSEVDVPRFVANSSSGNYWGLAAASAYVAGSRLFDASTNPGSAVTTTTVVVKSAKDGKTYTLVRRNIYSDPWDISMAVVSDIDEMVTSLEDVNANSIADADIESIDLETTFAAGNVARREADIVNVDVPGGLKSGVNTVTVSFLVYGDPDTHTVDATIAIPAGTPLTGTLSAQSANNGADFSDFSTTLFQEILGIDMESISGSSIDRRTVGDVVNELNEAVDNSVMAVTFQPQILMTADMAESLPDGFKLPAYDAIETTLATEWVVSSGAEKTAPKVDVYLEEPGTVPYGEPAIVDVDLLGVEADADVLVSGLGSTPETITLSEGSAMFMTPPLTKKATVTVSFAGNDGALPAAGTLTINVGSRTSLSASKTSFTHGTSTTLTAKVSPKDAGGSVLFQKWNGWTWTTVKTVALPSTGTVSYKYTPKRAGTVKFRARFTGSATNASSNSSSVTLRVK